MIEPLDEPLRKIARGTTIALVGMVLGTFLTLIIRLVIARYGLQVNYGIFSLALVVLHLANVVAGLGLLRGSTRYIAYFRGRKEKDKIRGVMSASLWLSGSTSILIGLVIFFSAEYIATSLFHVAELAPALKIFAAGIPFSTMTGILLSYFRGFDRIGPGIYFHNIGSNAIILSLLIVIIAASLSFNTVFYAYPVAIIVTFVVLVIYTIKKLPVRISLTNASEVAPVLKELTFFSLPLLGSAVMTMIMMRIDTLMLGFFKQAEAVGLYNTAFPLAMFISEPLAALILIYVPVATGLYSQNRINEMNRAYTVSTKWLVSLTLPVFLVLSTHPEAVLHLSFGQGYLPAADALRILSIGFIINNFLGPNGTALLTLGHTRFIMWANMATAMLNIGLNMLLIPPLGIVGAAIASVTSITIINIVRSWKLYSLSRTHPLSKNLSKPVFISVVLVVIIDILTRSFIPISVWMLPLLFILYCAIYGLAMLLTRSFDLEDLALLTEIEKRSGIKATPLKKLLRRFM
ncbi:flippase [Chloroflexota bacterium]